MPSSYQKDFLIEQLHEVVGSARLPKLSDHRFDKAHERFERSSNQQNLILKSLTELVLAFPFDESFKVLSVGCGSGILDNPLLAAIAAAEHTIHYTGIDPNPVACSRFQNEFEQLSLANVELDVRVETVETISGDERFDMIHAVHSLYYFDDPATAIEQLLERLKPGGKLVIFQAPKAELNQMADCFWFNDQQIEIWFSERLEDHINESGWDYAKSRIEARVDVTSCFDPLSADGALILDFITQVDCKAIEPATREHLLGYLDMIADVTGGGTLVPHPVDVFEIAAPR